MGWTKTLKVAAFAVAVTLAAGAAQAEVKVRISKGYGILYLPLIVMEDLKLLEKQAEKAGLGPLKVNWLMLDGGNVINAAMMAGSLDIAGTGTGAPGFITLWPRPRASRTSRSSASADFPPPPFGQAEPEALTWSSDLGQAVVLVADR